VQFRKDDYIEMEIANISCRMSGTISLKSQSPFLSAQQTLPNAFYPYSVRFTRRSTAILLPRSSRSQNWVRMILHFILLLFHCNKRRYCDKVNSHVAIVTILSNFSHQGFIDLIIIPTHNVNHNEL